MELCEVIRSYLKKEESNISVDDKLLSDALSQSLQALLYLVTKDKRIKKYYISQLVTQEKFITLQTELTDLFNKNQIKHFYVKGSVLYKLYDDYAIRSRGDIDVYVDPSDLDRAKKLMLDNGYTEEKADCMHHIGLHKDNLEVELHFALLDSYNGNIQAKVFEEPFKYAFCVKNSLYKLTDTMHLVFCLAHFARHLKMGGGYRYILDFYYILSKLDIDYIELHKYIDMFNYNVLWNNILNAIYYFTGSEFDNLEKKDIKFFLDYMNNSGIHGFKSGKTKPGFYGKNKVGYFFSRVFMTNKEYRISLYPRAGKHIIFYPFILIAHIFYLLTHKFKRLFEFIRRRPDKEKEKIYNDLGLFD